MPAPIKPRHHVAAESSTVLQTLIRHFRLEPARAAELVALGAIYCNQKRLEQDEPLKKGDHLQAYLTPARFPVEGVDWAKVVVQASDDYLVVNKPSGVPVHATVDNACDNLLFQLRAATDETLLVTQRLDTPVSGLIVLAKNAEFQRDFNRWLSEGKVNKTYRALTVKQLPLGRAVHYLDPEEKTPRVVSAEEKKGWQRAELEVLKSESVLLPASDKPFVSVEVRLLTGRTHQIRAQFSAMGAAIVGDKLYGSTVRYSKLKYGRGIALCSSALSWPGGPALTLPPPWAV